MKQRRLCRHFPGYYGFWVGRSEKTQQPTIWWGWGCDSCRKIVYESLLHNYRCLMCGKRSGLKLSKDGRTYECRHPDRTHPTPERELPLQAEEMRQKESPDRESTLRADWRSISMPEPFMGTASPQQWESPHPDNEIE